MKKIVIISAICVLLALSAAHAYDRGHSWDSGIVESIYEGLYKARDDRGLTHEATYDMMIISGTKYVVKPDCEFFELYKEGGKGSVNRRRINRRDISEGDRVMIKRIGRTLIEISREGR